MKTKNLIKYRSKSGLMYIFDAISNNIYNLDDNYYFEEVSLFDLGYKNEYRENALNNNERDDSAKTFIIELTEECNMRCTYCVFDESSNRDRNHSRKKNDITKIMSAIDSFYTRTNKQDAYIVFYGGEPLIEFEMMRDIVDYTLNNYGNVFKFSFTTNGILLTEDKFSFFVSNNFLITVSIDGPKEVNDRNRVLRNGKGTHSKVFEKLSKLKSKYPNYFENNVIFNCTINDVNDIEYINSYFSSEKIINSDSVRFAPSLDLEKRINSHILNSVSVDSVRDAIRNRDQIILQPVEKNFIGTIVDKIRFRKLDGLASSGKKICIPFSNRTYLRTNGNIQFCERIGSYGTIDKKDESEIKNYSSIFEKEFANLKMKECSVCFAYNFCEMCPASFIESGGYSNDLSESKCNNYREAVAKAFQIYIEEMEATSGS